MQIGLRGVLGLLRRCKAWLRHFGSNIISLSIDLWPTDLASFCTLRTKFLYIMIWKFRWPEVHLHFTTLSLRLLHLQLAGTRSIQQRILGYWFICQILLVCISWIWFIWILILSMYLLQVVPNEQFLELFHVLVVLGVWRDGFTLSELRRALRMLALFALMGASFLMGARVLMFRCSFDSGTYTRGNVNGGFPFHALVYTAIGYQLSLAKPSTSFNLRWMGVVLPGILASSTRSW